MLIHEDTCIHQVQCSTIRRDYCTINAFTFSFMFRWTNQSLHRKPKTMFYTHMHICAPRFTIPLHCTVLAIIIIIMLYSATTSFQFFGNLSLPVRDCFSLSELCRFYYATFILLYYWPLLTPEEFHGPFQMSSLIKWVCVEAKLWDSTPSLALHLHALAVKHFHACTDRGTL